MAVYQSATLPLQAVVDKAVLDTGRSDVEVHHMNANNSRIFPVLNEGWVSLSCHYSWVFNLLNDSSFHHILILNIAKAMVFHRQQTFSIIGITLHQFRDGFPRAQN